MQRWKHKHCNIVYFYIGLWETAYQLKLTYHCWDDGGEGLEGWTGVVSDPGPFSSRFETGIILPSRPSPHCWVSRLSFPSGLASQIFLPL